MQLVLSLICYRMSTYDWSVSGYKKKHHKKQKQVMLKSSKATFVQEIFYLSALFNSFKVAAGSDPV